jgi:predicted RND superfamily exporter protein
METENLFTHTNLLALRRVTDRIRQLPGVREAESLVNVISFRYVPEDEWVEVRRCIDEIPSHPDELADLRARALADPLYRKTIVSRDGRSGAINVTFQAMSDGEFVSLDLDGRIRRILSDEGHEGRRFYVAGRPHVRARAHHIMVRDLVRLIPLAVAVAAFVLWIMTGSLRSTLIPVVSCLTATLWAFGAMAVVGKDLNLVTLVLGPTLICVGSVYGVHVVARYEAAAGQAPDGPSAALGCLEYTRIPVLMAGGTTCVGFGALMLADVPATNELGGFSLFGVASVTLLSVTGVPAVLALLPLDPASRAQGQRAYLDRTRASAWIGAAFDRLLVDIGKLTVRYPSRILVAWGLVTGVAVAVIPHISIDTDFLSFFDRRSRVRTDFAAVNRLLAGAVPIYVSFLSSEEGTFREPRMLRSLERIQERLEGVQGVSQVVSMVDLVQIANRALEGGLPGGLRVPDSRAAAAETVFLIPKEKLRRYANANHSGANLVVRTGELGSSAVRALEERIHAALEPNLVPPGIRSEVTGNTILINHSADSISGNQAGTVGAAATTILVLVCLVFRSLRLAALTMVPNVVPVLIFFGVLGAGVAPLSVPTSLIGSIVLGIAVDDTVHFLVAYQRARSAGLSPQAAAERCVRQVGRPIMMTSVMLCVGFLVITTSGFATLREFGTLTAITMGICLTTDLLLMPALLVRVRA